MPSRPSSSSGWSARSPAASRTASVPTRVGGKFGWLQTIADGVKLLVKEDIIPADADQMLFRLGPYIAFCGSFLAFLALPFGNGVVA